MDYRNLIADSSSYVRTIWARSPPPRPVSQYVVCFNMFCVFWVELVTNIFHYASIIVVVFVCSFFVFCFYDYPPIFISLYNFEYTELWQCPNHLKNLLVSLIQVVVNLRHPLHHQTPAHRNQNRNLVCVI